MPTYEYQCTACKKRFEQYQSIKDKSLKKCPSCGKNALERLIGIGAAVIFKGSGFYQTDYRSESYRKAAEADTKAALPASTPETTGTKDSNATKAPAVPAVPVSPPAESSNTPASDSASTARSTQAKRTRSSSATTKPVKTTKKKR